MPRTTTKDDAEKGDACAPTKLRAMQDFMLTAIERAGVPTVMCCALLWFIYRTLDWERQQFMPLIQRTLTVLETNANVNTEISKSLKDHEQHLTKIEVAAQAHQVISSEIRDSNKEIAKELREFAAEAAKE